MINPDDYISILDLVGICRILFGLIFLAKLYVSYKASSLVWSHRLPMKSTKVLKMLLLLLMIICCCFTLGLYTAISALLMWALYVYLYRYASLYGLEDVSFQHMSFYFIFSSGNSAYSLDRILNLHSFGRLGAEDGYLPEVFLCIALGYIFFTAGYEKLFSPMWRKGLGAYFFYLMPQFRRIDTSFITRSLALSVFLNWLAIGMEIFLLPFILINAVPLGLFAWFLGVGFTLSLSSVFILTWIGECLTIGMMIILWLLLKTGNSSMYSQLENELLALPTTEEVLLAYLILASFLAGLFTIFVRRDSPKLTNSSLFKKIYIVSRYISRFSWGLLPLKVFTESHVEGPVVYRVYAVTHDGTKNEVFKIFNELCQPGIERPFRPAFFEVTSYKVAEACMELDAYNDLISPERKEFMFSLSEYILSRMPRFNSDKVKELEFLVKQIRVPGEFVGSHAVYADEPWTLAFSILINNKKAQQLKIMAKPILKYPTGRDINRLSFCFNPNGA